MRRSSFFAFVLAGIFLACNSGSDDQSGSKSTYFDLKGFVGEQIALLTDLHPVVFRNMRIDGQKDQYMGAEVDWARELDLFVQADLNKPSLRESYTITRPDSLTYEYHPKPEEKPTVEYLKVVLDPVALKPALVEARIRTNNKLYDSAKNLRMECGMQGKEWRINSYEISGYQDLTLAEKKHFSTKTSITY